MQLHFDYFINMTLASKRSIIGLNPFENGPFSLCLAGLWVHATLIGYLAVLTREAKGGVGINTCYITLNVYYKYKIMFDVH